MNIIKDTNISASAFVKDEIDSFFNLVNYS